MNATDKKSISELVTSLKDGKISQEGKDNLSPYLTDEVVESLKSSEIINTVKREGSIRTALRNRRAANASSVSLGDTPFSAVDVLQPLNEGSGSSKENSSLLSSSLGYAHPSGLLLYKDIPTGKIDYINLRSMCVSKKAKDLMSHTIEQMKSKIEYYGENSVTITGKTWIEHFKAYVAPDINWESPIGKDYLYLLFIINNIVSYSSVAHPMSLNTLTQIKYILDDRDGLNFNFNFDRFSTLMLSLLGITERMGNIFVQGPEYYLNELKFYYDNDHMEPFSSMVNTVISYFLDFTHYTVLSRNHLTLDDPTSTKLEIPCGYYVEREDYIDGTVLTTHLSFEAYGKRIYLEFYYYEIRVDNDTITIPGANLAIYE